MKPAPRPPKPPRPSPVPAPAPCVVSHCGRITCFSCAGCEACECRSCLHMRDLCDGALAWETDRSVDDLGLPLAARAP